MPAPDLDRVHNSKVVAHPGDFLSAAREPNSKTLWAGHADGKIYAIDFGADKPAAKAALRGHASYVSGLGVAGKTLVSAGWDRKLIWWDLQKRERVRSIDAHDRWVRQLAVNAAGTVIATVSDDMTCKLWDAATGRLIRRLTGFNETLLPLDYPNKVFTCSFTPDGRHVAATDAECKVIVWEVESGREAARFEAADFLFSGMMALGSYAYSGIRRTAFSPDGRTLALAGIQNKNAFIHAGKGLLQLFDWRAGKKAGEQQLGSGQIEGLYWHPKSDWLLAAHGSLYFLDPARLRVLKEVKSGEAATADLAVNEAASAVYAVGRGKACRWEIPS